MTESKQKPIWRIISPVKKQVSIAITLSVCSSLLSVAILVLLAYLIQSLYDGNTQHVYVYFLSILVCTIINYLFRLRSFDESHFAAFDLEAVLRKNISSHLSILPLGFLTQSGSGALTKIINDDVRALHGFVGDATPLYARAFAFPLFTFIGLLWFDYRMALISLAILGIGLGLLATTMRNRGKLVKSFHQAREDISTSIVEYVQAMPVVRVFDGGESPFRRYDKALVRFKDILTGWYKENGLTAKVSMLVLNPLPSFIILLVVGVYWFQQGYLGLGQLMGALLLGTGMIESIMPYRSLYHVIEQSNMSAIRIEELLAVESLPVSELDDKPKDSSVMFNKVNFTYPDRKEKALNDISFVVKPGSFTALVGTSGAGKSTVAKLIPRYWDISSGTIQVGQVDVRDMKAEALMNHIAFVFQDNFLFSDTIANNIRLGHPDASDEEMIEAAKSAQAHDFIMQLPDGYQTNAGERGESLSGGEKQRIAIARAILQNRPILILDEATSFSDTENEALLIKAITNLMKDKTVIMIAHRLTTIKSADQILVFERGNLVDKGNHDELLSSKGIYREMWEANQQTRNWHIKTQN